MLFAAIGNWLRLFRHSLALAAKSEKVSDLSPTPEACSISAGSLDCAPTHKTKKGKIALCVMSVAQPLSKERQFGSRSASQQKQKAENLLMRHHDAPQTHPCDTSISYPRSSASIGGQPFSAQVAPLTCHHNSARSTVFIRLEY